MAFLAANKSQEGVTVTDSGLQYQVLVASDGKQPGPHDSVTFHYQLKTLDGQILEDSKRTEATRRPWRSTMSSRVCGKASP